MEGHELVDAILSVALGVFGTGLIICRIGWRRAEQKIRDLELELHRQSGPAEVAGDTRLVERVESLAVQLDRLAEGQEFLSRVIADRTLPRDTEGVRPR